MIPLTCRLRGHTWQARPVRGGQMRKTCKRCYARDLPTSSPEKEVHS